MWFIKHQSQRRLVKSNERWLHCSAHSDQWILYFTCQPEGWSKCWQSESFGCSHVVVYVMKLYSWPRRVIFVNIFKFMTCWCCYWALFRRAICINRELFREFESVWICLTIAFYLELIFSFVEIRDCTLFNLDLPRVNTVVVCVVSEVIAVWCSIRGWVCTPVCKDSDCTSTGISANDFV